MYGEYSIENISNHSIVTINKILIFSANVYFSTFSDLVHKIVNKKSKSSLFICLSQTIVSV